MLTDLWKRLNITTTGLAFDRWVEFSIYLANRANSFAIDVREPDEVMMGSIPASVNLPLSNLEKALDMDGSDFMRAYGFRKPAKSMPLIFFCKAGVRSSSAVSLAKGKGFNKVRNYPGSYADVRPCFSRTTMPKAETMHCPPAAVARTRAGRRQQ